MSALPKIDPYLLRGGVVMAGTAALYMALEDAAPVATAYLAVVFFGGAMLAVASPTRWSVRTTIRLYRALPVFVGTSAVLTGGYYFVTFDMPILSLVVVFWGTVILSPVWFVTWGAVESRIRRQKADDETEAMAPFPPATMSRGRYAGVGLTILTSAVVLSRLLVSLDLGILLILLGVALGGLLHAVSSPYSGSPHRVVRVRQARLFLPATCIAAGSVYGYLTTADPLGPVLWGVVAAALFVQGIRTDWQAVAENVVETQTETTPE